MIVAVALLPAAAPAQTEHPLTADSERQPGVPAGRVSKHAWRSAIFPGTQRDYWVCVPAQYRPETPAAVMVFQDGGRFVAEDGRWRVPVVFDNLIHRGEMPVTVGVGGSSSGGICAFTAAWNRPDAFRRVLSFIGSYTGLRGGDSYPTLIRKTEPRPIRVFLQDGSRDLDIYSGNWWVGNQAMASALEYAGYDVRFIAGAGGHDSNHGFAILPDALRWRWRERKEPITPPSDGKESMIAGRLEVDHLVVGANGGIWATDASHRRVWYVDPHGGKRVVHEGLRSPRALALSADQALLAVADAFDRCIWSFALAGDGSARHGEPFYRLELGETGSAAGTGGLTVDSEGYLYVATTRGIQVFDQPGRVTAIIDLPAPSAASSIVFGGRDLDTLYLTSGDQLFRRRLRRKGVFPGQIVKLPTPRL